jgi:outer membrane protein
MISRSITIFLLIIILFFPEKNACSGENKKNTTLFLSIDDVRSIAVKNNLDIKLAQLDSEIKGTELSFKEAVFDTILKGAVDYTKDETKPASALIGSKSVTNNYNIGFDKKLKSGTDISVDFMNKRVWSDSEFISPNPYHDSRIELKLIQPVARNFFGLIDRGNIELIKKEIKNTALDSYIKIEDALIASEKAYWEMVFAKEKFKIQKEMMKKAVILFNRYREKLKIGLVEAGEVLAAEANTHIRESELLIALNELKTSEELLKLNLNISNKINLFPKNTLSKTPFDRSFTQSLNTAFEKRRDYLSRKIDMEEADIELKMKSNSLFPEIDLKATFTTNGLSDKYYRAIEGVSEDSNPRYYAGIEFRYPLENNEAESEHEKSVLTKTKVIIDLRKTERQIISDIDNRFRELSVNKVNIPKMERVNKLQEGKLFQEEKKFRYGRSSSDILIRYQEDVLNSKITVKKAYFDYKISILDLMNVEDSYLNSIDLE